MKDGNINLCVFCISSQQSLHIRTLLHYNLKLPNVYVGIVGWIYSTKIDPISILFIFIFYFIIIILSNVYNHIWSVSVSPTKASTLKIM